MASGSHEIQPSALRRPVLALALLAAALSIARHLPLSAKPFAQTMEGINGGLNVGWSVRCWDRLGFFHVAGRPFLGAIPTDPATGQLYVNHPPLMAWTTYAMTRAFGMTELAIRVLPIFSSAVVAFLLTWLLGTAVSTRAAWVVLLLFFTSPIVFEYGAMANYESPLLGLSLLAFMLEPLRDRGRAHLVLSCSVLALAVWMDWIGCLLLPALAVGAWVSGRHPVTLRRLAAVGGAVLAAAGAYAALVAWWLGSVGAAVARIVLSAEITQLRTFTFLEWLGAQADHVGSLFTWPVALLGAVGVVLACVLRTRRHARVGELVVVFSTLGAISVAAFAGRSFNHEYWVYPWVPAILGGVTLLVEECWVSRAGAGRLLVAGALAVVCVYGGWRCVARARAIDFDEPRPTADAVNGICGADTLLVLQLDGGVEVGTWVFYARAWVLPLSTQGLTTAALPVAAVRRGDGGLRRMVVVQTTRSVAEHPAFAMDLRAHGFHANDLGTWTLFELGG